MSYTLEELQAMTDDQLIEKVAVEVMGFQKCPNPNNDGTAYFKVSLNPDNHTPLTGYRLIRAEDDPDERWNPLTDWNHTMEVVDDADDVRMDRCIDTEKRGSPLTWRCRLRWDEGQSIEAWDKHRQRAICIAALLACSPKSA